MKTLDTQFHKGSYIDAATKTVMTPSAVNFVKTRKGVAAEFTDPSSPVNYIDTNIPSNQLVGANCAIEAWFSLKKSGNGYIFFTTRSTGSSFMSLYCSAGTLRGYFANNANSVNTTAVTTSISQHTDYHCLFVRENTSDLKLYVNNVLVSSASLGGQSPSADTSFIGAVQGSLSSPFKGTVYKVRTYNHVPTQKEMDDMYQEFITARLTAKPIRCFVKPKAIDLSRKKDAGLVAAYNMKAVNSVLYDISGNGRNGVVGGAINTKDGLLYSNFAKTILTGTATGGAKPLELPGSFTICTRLKPTSTASSYIVNNYQGTAPYTGKHILLHQDPSGSGIVFKGAVDDDVNNSAATTGVLNINQFYNVCFVRELGSKVKIYVDGSLAAEENDLTTGSVLSNLDWVIGNRSNGTVDIENYRGEINNVKFYNRAFTAAEAKAYHNSFVQPTLIEDFSSYGVGTTPDKWIPVSGSYNVEESAATGKYLVGVTNGLTAIQNTQSYGVWEMDFYKSTEASYVYFLISSNENKLSTSQLSYSIGVDNQQRVFFGRANSNTFLNNILVRTNTNYVAINTWYRFRLERTTNNVFTLYIKGGAFTNWTIVSATGGTGSNPITDTTYTKGNYFVVNLGTGDRISNIKLLDGIIQQ